jgi:nucleotide-binding universal stress UspA family protein
MIKKILVPIDGSRMSQKAAKYAVGLAKQTGASLTLLIVIDTRFVVGQSVSASASPTHLKETVEDYLKQSAQSSMDEIAAICKRDRMHCKTALRTGHPVEEIVKEAAKAKADLIVMGSQGKSALKAAVLALSRTAWCTRTRRSPFSSCGDDLFAGIAEERTNLTFGSRGTLLLKLHGESSAPQGLPKSR